MTPRFRTALFLAAGAVVLAMLVAGLRELAPFGAYPGPYGDILNSVAVPERHVLNVTAAVIFDYRGFDTLGEEFILFTCVTGVTLLLREETGARKSSARGRRGLSAQMEAGDALRFFGPMAAGPILVFGAYTALTGHLSVGGGFQGGVVLSAAWLMAGLAHGSALLRRISSTDTFEWLEALGAGGFILIGTLGLIAGRNFLSNVLPLGVAGHLLSSGTILLLNCTVAVEVAAGLVLLLREFVKPLEPEIP